MNSYFKIIYIIIILFLFYILYINNIYLSYKVYNNKKFNDYDKTMLKITSIIQSIIFALTLLIITYALSHYKKTYEHLMNNKYDIKYELISIILMMMYYGHSVYINYNNFNNKYNFDDLKDEKNKNLRYHLYLSIPLLLLVIPTMYKSYNLSLVQ